MVDINEYFDFENANLDPESLASVQGILVEIAETPEGADLIKKASANTQNGIINFEADSSTFTQVKGDTLILGSLDASAQYIGNDDNYYDLSIQRILVHEIAHLAEEHTNWQLQSDRFDRGEISVVEIGPKEMGLRYIPENEADAVRITNDFMSKYYNEVPRAEYLDAKLNPDSPHWDNANSPDNPIILKEKSGGAAQMLATKSIDTGVPDDMLITEQSQIDIDDLRANMNQLTEAQVQSLGPEMQHLYEVKGSPEQFESAVSEYAGTANFQNSIDQVSTIVMDKNDLGFQQQIETPEVSPSPMPLIAP